MTWMSVSVTSMSAIRARRRRHRAVVKASRVVNSSQDRAQKRRRRRRLAGPAIQATYRTSRLLAPDMRVRYAHEVTERSIDKAAWSELIGRLIAQETGGNKSRFAALVGVNYKTVLRWLAKEGEVSIESVGQVADAVGVSPIELMVRVGYYRTHDIPQADPKPARDPDDEALRIILESEFPNRIKMRMIQRLEQLRDRDRQRESDEVRFWIEQMGEQNPEETPERA